ncbi:hypothetical protein QBC41DRAFT_222836, partial [Cercophora samala]
QQVAMTNPFNWSAIRVYLPYLRLDVLSSIDYGANILSGARLGIDDDDEDTTLTPATITAVANTIVDELHNKNKIPIEELRHHVLRMQDKSEDLYFTESRAIIKVYDDFFTAAMARLEKLYADRMRLQLILEDFGKSITTALQVFSEFSES